MAKSNERNRIFATVIYPESAPEPLDIISDWHIEAFFSLHDQDLMLLENRKNHIIICL